jgi:HEPN domain-containing protein
MNQSKYEKLFKEIIRSKHGMEIDFEKIESKLAHLSEGMPLTYSDLEIIGDDSCWPFSKYWMWPSNDQIEKYLPKTKGWFKNLPIREEETISNLTGIFKNIALVSIILRFVHPLHYAIYSRPPLKMLRVERGINDTAEYMNYLQVMRTLRKSFGVSKTADVDIIVWATAYAKGEHLRTLKKLLADRLPENLGPGEIITYLSSDPLKIAELYLKINDYETAGYWAAIALEKFLREQCFILFGYIPTGGEGEIITIINYLCKTETYINKGAILHRLRNLRNRAVHISKKFTKDDAKYFIETIKSLITSYR